MMWTFFLLVLMIPLLAVVLDSQLGRALARRIEEGRVGRGDERIAALEAEVERLSRELETVQEQAEFVTKLLEDRSRGRLPKGEEGD